LFIVLNALAVLSICICFIVKKEKKEIYDGGVANVFFCVKGKKRIEKFFVRKTITTLFLYVEFELDVSF